MSNTTYVSCADTAKLVRRDLKAAFPSAKFSVRSSTYSMGASIDVKWTDGPTEKEVKHLVGKYEGSTFDGSIDLKSYHTSKHPDTGELVHWGADSILCNRDFSAAFLRPIVETTATKYGLRVQEVKENSYGGAYIDSDDTNSLGNRGDDLATLVWRACKDISALKPTAKTERISGILAEQHGDGWHILGNTFPHRVLFREHHAASVKGDDGKHAYWLIASDTLPDAIQALVSAEPATKTPTSPAAKFRQSADALQATIDKKRNIFANSNPTPRRARFQAQGDKEARELETVQDKLRALADAWDANTVPATLQGVTTKGVVEYLVAFSNYPQPGGAYDKEHTALSRAGITTPEAWKDARADLLALGNADAGKTTQADQIKAKERDLIGRDIAGYFPTPEAIVNVMLQIADIDNADGVRVLEPSAGKGNIADAIRARCPLVTLDCVEPVPALRDILTLKGHTLAADDILSYLAPAYDVVVMNPPFENGQDVAHVQHVYDVLLKPGGRLVSVVSESVFFRSERKYADFRAWVDAHGYDVDLPAGAFEKSDRPTSVKTRLIVIDKPANVTAQPVAESPALPAAVPDFAAVLADVLRDYETTVTTLAARCGLRADLAQNPVFSRAHALLKEHQERAS